MAEARFVEPEERVRFPPFHLRVHGITAIISVSKTEDVSSTLTGPIRTCGRTVMHPPAERKTAGATPAMSMI